MSLKCMHTGQAREYHQVFRVNTRIWSKLTAPLILIKLVQRTNSTQKFQSQSPRMISQCHHIIRYNWLINNVHFIIDFKEQVSSSKSSLTVQNQPMSSCSGEWWVLLRFRQQMSCCKVLFELLQKHWFARTPTLCSINSKRAIVILIQYHSQEQHQKLL